MDGVRSGSFGNLPSVVRPYLFNGAEVEASFQLDVTGNTINSISGLLKLDGNSANITSIFNNSFGGVFRGFSMRFDDVGTGLGTLHGVEVSEMAFRMSIDSGDTIEEAFEGAIGDNSTFFRASITAAHQQSNNSVRFYRGFLDGDGSLSNQTVALSAAIPLTAGLLLMLTGLAGFGFLARKRSGQIFFGADLASNSTSQGLNPCDKGPGPHQSSRTKLGANRYRIALFTLNFKGCVAKLPPAFLARTVVAVSLQLWIIKMAKHPFLRGGLCRRTNPGSGEIYVWPSRQRTHSPVE